MARYQKFNPPRPPYKGAGAVHPVWRGIGCIMMLIIPVVGYAGAVLLVQENIKQRWLAVPADLAQTVTVPLFGAVPYLYANLLAAAVLTMLGFGLVTVLYGFLYTAVGPSRYGPLDAPPARKRRRVK